MALFRPGFVDDFFQNVYHTMIVDIYIHIYIDHFYSLSLSLYIIYMCDTCIHIVYMYTYCIHLKYMDKIFEVSFDHCHHFFHMVFCWPLRRLLDSATQMDRDASRKKPTTGHR